MNRLEKIASKHKYWINIVKGFGCNQGIAEDIVQEAYIKLHYRLEKGLNIDYGVDDINNWYIRQVLWSVYMDFRRAEGRSIITSSDADGMEFLFESITSDISEYNEERDRDFNILWKKIVAEMNTWDVEGEFPYNKTSFIAYMSNDISFTRLANDTSVPRNSLVNTVYNGRAIIAEKFGEEIKEYFKKY